MTKIPRTRRAGGAKRIAALGAVAEILAARGYENTRFADVSAASGVAISTLQTYFGSREDMLIEAMRRSTDEEVAALEAAAGSEKDPWRRLVALIDRSLGNSERTRQVLIEFWRAGMRDEELRDYSVQVRTRYREPFVRSVTEGRDQGAFVLTSGPDDVVDFLLAALGGVMIPRVLHHPGPSPEGFRHVLLSHMRLALGLPG
ncbi:TetR/AcrR family transcriptional regulator [Streptomyces sp. NBC_01497]|uniref:TetR/AcrR family transcriptional regulator n=1 Tax=Streptomyces sp. NBC_01497 TaxID=2903885 RepID=UPI002E3356FC|nr:TetR/AcrR family transcriptional regulator [Streptomyces sp. NBC_01497]